MQVFFNNYYHLRKMVFFLGEGLLIFLSLLVVDWYMLTSGFFHLDLPLNAARALLVTLIFQLCLYFFDLYDVNGNLTLPITFTRMIQAFGVGCVILAAIYYLFPFLIITTLIFWTGYIWICLTVTLWLGTYYFILRNRYFVQNILVVGTGTLAADIAQEVEGVQDSVHRICGFVGTGRPTFNPYNAPVRSRLEDYEDLFLRHKLQRIIVALDDLRGETPIKTLLKCKMRGISIEQGVSFYERLTGKILVEKVPPSSIIYSDGFRSSWWTSQLKRTIDVIAAVLLFSANLPVLLLTALLIKLESPGPIFYVQERVGEKNRPFRLIKFRSMRQDAESNGAVWAAENDPRVTRIGSIIRRLRIDELPQLINIFKGEMSLVGPRPERRIFVDELVKKIPFYDIRHEVKPGVTGWAQVCYPYGASELDALKKLEYDLYYMKNLSIAFDFLIIFKTAKTVLARKGSR